MKSGGWRILATIGWCMAVAVGVWSSAGVASAQDALEVTGDELLQQGAEQLEAEEFSTARETFSQLVAGASLDPRGYFGRAQALIGLEKYEEALQDFKDALDRAQSPDPDMQRLRAAILHARGEMYVDLGPQLYGTALPDLQAAHELDPENLQYAFTLGKVYAAASPQNPPFGEQAIPLLTGFLDANPDHAEALRYRGQAYASIRKFEESLADINRSLELEPEEHLAHFALGAIYLQQEDYRQAVDAFDAAIANYTPEDPESELPYAQGYLTKAAALEELGKVATDPAEQVAAFTRQVEACDELLALLPEGQDTSSIKVAAHFRRGVGLRLLGKFGAAVNSLTEAIDLNPEMGEAYFRRAICFHEMGEPQLALLDLEATQSLNFEDPRAYLWEGLTYAQMGNYRDAIRAYNAAISFSNRYLDAYLNRAHAYFQLDEYERAIESFNECIRLQPTQAAHYYKRGLSQRKLGRIDQAVQSYTNAIEINDRYWPAYDALIPELERQGRRELADEYRRKRAQMGPPATAAR